MIFYLNVNSSGITSSYILNNESKIPIVVSEFDYLDIEFESDDYYHSNDLKIIIGNIHFVVDEPISLGNKFYYRLNLNFISSILPGKKDAHLSSSLFQTNSGKRRFSRILINEIGKSNIHLLHKDYEEFIGSVIVETSKISKESYELITLYLISNGYFDSNIIYKSVLEGSQSDIQNSLLEALRELVKRLERWHQHLNYFTFDPIVKYSTRGTIVTYDSSHITSEESLEWLVNNMDVFNRTNQNSSRIDVIFSSKPYTIEKILAAEAYGTSDAYENKIIHGFIYNLTRLLSDIQEHIKVLRSARTRISSFKDFIIDCFHDLIQSHITDSANHIRNIDRFFKKKLPVSNPRLEFPKRIDGFVSKEHYKEVLDLIVFSKNIFSFDIQVSNFNLEIESFDKLFEVYCFYIIKDTIKRMCDEEQWIETKTSESNSNNKLKGVYSIKYSDYDIQFYYENLPEEFQQFAKSKFPYNPDFVLSISDGNDCRYIILDAKYKKYDRDRLQDDLGRLTLNYLHKIGLKQSLKSKVVALYTISISSNNLLTSIFRNDFDIYGNYPVTPQIGNIEINPEKVKIDSNFFNEIIDFAISCIERQA